MILIDGKKIANKILESLTQRVRQLKFQPLFCDILVGEDPVSLSYVKIKERTARKIGLEFLIKQFSKDISQARLLQEVDALNMTPKMCGLILQLPLPAHLDRQTCLNAIRPDLDVDCIGEKNSSDFYSHNSPLFPPTAAAIVEILNSLGTDWSGKKILVLGQGDLVGKPVSFLLKSQGLQVVDADRSTKDLLELMKAADVIISGTGQPGLITGNLIKPGCVLIDAGTAETAGGIAGDVDFNSAQPVAGAISPVPGGVGPVTVAKLLENVVQVAETK